jgi:nitric oxide reductase subunit B
MMGVYGMLSVGLALFCQRYMIPENRWSERAAMISFWSLNIGLAWMVFATLFPLGVLQLYHSVSQGYFDARALQFITGGANPVLEWLRLPGDVLFIAGGVLPLLYLSWCSIRYMAPRRPEARETEEVLFKEIVERSEAK